MAASVDVPPRVRQFASELAQPQPMRRGSVSERAIRCGKANCACADDALLAARVNQKAKKPSVEAVFHAWLLTLPGINFIGHAHATAVNQVLCSPRARDFATHRMFPDEIVCCSVASVLIPYTDPGLKLAQTIRKETEAFIQKLGHQPRIILMQNHGTIALGASWQAVLTAMLMAEKAAKIFVGAAALGA